MSEHAAAASHDEHHDDPWSHVPPPSFWPFKVGIALVLFTMGTVFVLDGQAFLHEGGESSSILGWLFGWTPDQLGNVDAFGSTWKTLGTLSLVAGVFGLFYALMGWCHQIIKEKRIAHDLGQQQVDLKMFVKLFLVSELMAFAAVFAYYYLRTFAVDPESFHQPEGAHIGGAMVAFATLLLLSSSVTCEMAHHAVMHRQWGKARLLMLSTLLLGVIFLGFQGYEYGLLMQHGYFPFDGSMSEGPVAFMATFFIGTGFHGLHVLTGLVMLFLVYVRLEMGHFTKDRHFALIAASWYWHFVDIVWILLFISVYVV